MRNTKPIKNKKLKLVLVFALALLIALPMASAFSPLDALLQFFGFGDRYEYNAMLPVEANEVLSSNDGWFLCETGETYYRFCQSGSTEMQMISYGDRINYFEDGRGWQPIDPTLQVSDRIGFDYEIEKGYYRAYFDMGNLKVDINRDNWYFNLEEVGLAEINNGQYNSIMNVVSNNGLSKHGAVTKKLEKIVSTTANTDMNYSIEFEYLNSMLRETVIFGSKPTLKNNKVLTYVSKLDTNMNIYVNGVLWTGNFVTTTNEIKLTKGNESVYLVKPVAYDSAGAEAPVTYGLFKISGVSYLAKFTDNSWLLDSARVYPLYIDPTTSMTQARSFITADTYTAQDSPTSNYGTATTFDVRSRSTSTQNHRGYLLLDFSNLIAREINTANLYIDQTAQWYLAGVDLEATYCNTTFGETNLTWNNQGTEITGCESQGNIATDIDYSASGWKTLNVTANVTNEFNSGDKKFTVKLQMNPESYSSTAYYATFDSRQGTNKPYLSIKYNAYSGKIDDVGTGLWSRPNLYQDDDGMYWVVYRRVVTGTDYLALANNSVFNSASWTLQNVAQVNFQDTYQDYQVIFKDNNDVVRIIYTKNAYATEGLFERNSTDNGTTWGAERTILSSAGRFWYLPTQSTSKAVNRMNNGNYIIPYLRSDTAPKYLFGALIYNSTSNAYTNRTIYSNARYTYLNSVEYGFDIKYNSDNNELYALSADNTNTSKYILNYSTNYGSSWSSIGYVGNGAYTANTGGLVIDNDYLWLIGERNNYIIYSQCDLSTNCKLIGNWSSVTNTYAGLGTDPTPRGARVTDDYNMYLAVLNQGTNTLYWLEYNGTWVSPTTLTEAVNYNDATSQSAIYDDNKAFAMVYEGATIDDLSYYYRLLNSITTPTNTLKTSVYESENVNYSSIMTYDSDSFTLTNYSLSLGGVWASPTGNRSISHGNFTETRVWVDNLTAPLVTTNNTNQEAYWRASVNFSGENYVLESTHTNQTIKWSYWLGTAGALNKTTQVMEYEKISGYFTLGHIVFNSSYSPVTETAFMSYNGTTTTMTKTDPTTATSKFTNNTRAPIMLSSNSSLKTANMYAVLTLDGVSKYRGNTTASQNVHKFVFRTTTGTNYTKVFDFYLKNEIGGGALTGNMDSTWTTTSDISGYERNYSFARSGASTYAFYYYPNWANFTTDSDIQYWSGTTYPRRDYYLNDVALTSSTHNNITLYLINSTVSELVTIHVTDQLNDPVENAVVRIQKYNVGTNTYTTVASSKTDYLGLAQEYLEIGDTYYRFAVEKEGYETYQTSNLKVTTADIYLRISLLEEDYEDWVTLSQLNYTLTYSNDTKLITYTFDDASGLINQWCLQVTGDNIYGGNSTGLSNQCVNTTSGVITYNVTNATAQAYEQITANGWVYSSNPRLLPQPMLLRSLTLSLKTALLGLTGVFVALLLILLCALIGIFNPTVSIVLTMFGIVVSAYMRLLSISTGAVVAIIAVGVFIVYKMRT